METIITPKTSKGFTEGWTVRDHLPTLIRVHTHLYFPTKDKNENGTMIWACNCGQWKVSM